MASLQELIAASPGVSARPDSVVSLVEVIEDPVVEADKLVPIVEQDPGLTAGLLKLCNSPIYNFKRRIGSPREALVLVGNLTFARLCFTLSLEPVLHRDLPGYQLDMGTLWQHSLGTAYGAAFLVKTMGLGDLRDRAFTAGLLHDIGKLVLDGGLVQAAGDGTVDQQRSAVPDVADTDNVTLDLERRRTGYDHAEAGAAMLDSWNLPDQIVAAVRWHHDPTSAGTHCRLAQAVHVADRVAHFASKLSAGSLVIEQWVRSNFDSSAFAEDSIVNLAQTVAAKHSNIISLATGPSL